MLIRVGKLQFICLIGGRVFNPRQQQYVVNVYLWSLSARTYITYNFTYLLHTTTQFVPRHKLKHTGYALALQRTNGLHKRD